MGAARIKSEYELERGKPMPSKNHALVQGNLYFYLRQYFEGKYKVLTEVSILVEGKERIPDLAVFKNLQFTPGNDEVKVKEIPIGVIEIISPTQNLTELISKSDLYFQSGVQSYWLVLPDLRSIYVFHEPGEYSAFLKEEQLTDEVMGITLGLADVFK